MTAPPADILQRLVADARGQLEAHRRVLPLEELKARVRDLPPPPSFTRALAGTGVAVIAEIKRGSPSKGLLLADFDHRRLARAYVEAGAAAISVLTEERSFLGSLDHLREVNAELGGRVPLLRKDFLFDEYQLFEAREAGAAAALLIVAILSPRQLSDLAKLAEGIGLDALVEVHDEAETEVALGAGATIVGVNNRDLRTFHTDLSVSERLRAVIPPSVIMVSESGIHSPADVRRLSALPVDAVLVGEHLVTSADPAAGLRRLLR